MEELVIWSVVLRQYIPQRQLSMLDSIWELIAEPSDEGMVHPVPPFGMPEILLFVGRRRQIVGVNAERGLLKGQYTQLQVVEFDGPFHLVVIRLKPYGLRQVFGLEAGTLVDGYTDAEQLPLVKAMADVLEEAGSVESGLGAALKMLEAVEEFEISSETRRFLQLVEESSSSKVEEVIREQGIGMRTLQRRMQMEVGLSPKHYLRIRRMAQMQLAMSPDPDWLGLVAEYAFADQSHLVKEFKHLMRHTPADFVKHGLNLREIFPKSESRLI